MPPPTLIIPPTKARRFIESPGRKPAPSEAGEIPLEMGMNQEGAVAGCCNGTDGNWHSFLHTARGTITSFDDPDAVNGTFTQAINTSGAIAGYYADANRLGSFRNANRLYSRSNARN